MPANSSVRGRVVVVTGGAHGIGRAAVTALASAGARVAIGDIDARRAGELAAALGGGAIGLGLDVSNRASFEAFLTEVERRLGPVDVLINNAAILALGEFAHQPDSTTERVLAVNFGGTAIGCKLALTRMVADGRGRIVNVAPAPWLARVPGAAAYGAAGHAVIALTRSLQAEQRDSGVSVQLLLVGPTQTDMLAGLRRPRLLRPRKPADVAEHLLAALESDQPELTSVRGVAGPAARWFALRGRAASLWLAVTGASDLFSAPDAVGRAAYQARIEQPAAGRAGSASVAQASGSGAQAVREGSES